MGAYLLKRHSPDWAGLTQLYRQNGSVDKHLYLPDPVPHGFPPDIIEKIDVWNRAFGVSFFECRARLNEIAEDSFLRAKDIEVVSLKQLDDITISLRGSGNQSLIFFSDDDDWIAPDLIKRLGPQTDAHTVRWNAPIFNGLIVNRPVWPRLPRLSFRLRQLMHAFPGRFEWIGNYLERESGPTAHVGGIDSAPIAYLFQTNNYAINTRLIRTDNILNRVIDHVDASKFVMRRPQLKVHSIGNTWGTITIKHPCSATAFGHAGDLNETEASLRNNIEGFLLRADRLVVPEELKWAKPYILETIRLFEEVLT